MLSTSLWWIFTQQEKHSERVEFKYYISGGAMYAFRKVPLKLREVKPSKTFAFVNFKIFLGLLLSKFSSSFSHMMELKCAQA